MEQPKMVLSHFSLLRCSMSHETRLSAWQQEVSSAFSHLSKAQASGLALWSAGIALLGCCGMVQVSALLAAVLGQHEQNVLQRLREWYLDASRKSGKHRDDVDVSACFGPLLRWIMRLWHDPEGKKRLVLAMDATSLGERWTVLAISVVIRHCAIPVAWKVIRMYEPGSWKPYWEALFQELKGSIDPQWMVIVTADRGLYARWLFKLIQGCQWHPFLRINTAVKARREGSAGFEWIGSWVKVGEQWAGPVECFIQKPSRLVCTLLMAWEAGHEDPWIVLTDLAEQECTVAWYGMRTWVECGFKDFKRGGFDWQYSRMEQASQVERLWLAMAVALVWMVSLGSHYENQQQDHGVQQLPEQHVARRKRTRALHQKAPRKLSCPMRGKILICAMLVKGEAMPSLQLVAEPWPTTVPVGHRPLDPAKEKAREKQRRRKRVQKAGKTPSKAA
jgi:hypothetical protein